MTNSAATGGPIPTLGRTLMDFRARMDGGGARSNLFECEITFPPGTLDNDDDIKDISDKTRFLIKAANLPASTIGVIDVPFRGRNLKIAGDRTFDPWTITIINDTDFSIRNAFEKWMNFINKHQDAAGKINPSEYQQDAIIYQLGRSSATSSKSSKSTPTFGDADTRTPNEIPILKQYKFYGVFPSSISAIDVSYDSSDTIEEFTVDLQVQWWDARDPKGETQLGTTEDKDTLEVSNQFG